MGYKKKQGNFIKTSTSDSLKALKPLTLWITTNGGKFLETGIPDPLTCLLRNLYAGQEVTEPDMEQWTSSKLRKEYIKAVYCHPAYFNLCVEYVMQNAELDKAHAGIKIAGRNINNLRYSDDTTLMPESKEELKSL